jgi:hypothetical protein
MPETTAHQRTTKLSSGRLVFARTDNRKLGKQIADNQDARCDFQRCDKSRYKLGRYCRAHALKYSRTGHPAAETLRRSQWAPYVALSTTFVNAHLRAGHPGIEAAVRWLASELHPQGAVVSRSDPKRPHRGYAAALTRCRRNGVEPVDLLARVIAAELADDRGDAARPMFASDAHRRHQSARLFLYAIPHGAAGFSKRRREPSAIPAGESVNISFRVREYTHTRVHNALGLLACHAADELRRRMADSSPPPTTPDGPVPGSSISFHPHTTQD